MDESLVGTRNADHETSWIRYTILGKMSCLLVAYKKIENFIPQVFMTNIVLLLNTKACTTQGNNNKQKE
jgi:hypothetical protein